jgi:hypothetical protein
MYTPKDVAGQTYTNRIRRNVARVMSQRGMAGSRGLPHMSSAGLFKFLSGNADITITRLQHVADDLGVSVGELLSNAGP